MASFTTRPPAWTDTAPIKVSASREIVASSDRIWAALCEHETWPTWFPGIHEAAGTGGEGLGSTRFVTLAGGRIRVDEEFIVWDEPRSWGFTVTAGSGPFGWLVESLNERIDIQPLSADRVRITYLMAFAARPRRARMLRSVAKGMGRNLEAALASLDRHVTGPADGSGTQAGNES